MMVEQERRGAIRILLIEVAALSANARVASCAFF